MIFNKPASIVISICVAVLCIIGMNQFLSGRGSVILLPYAALGFSILFLLLFTVIYNSMNRANKQPQERPRREQPPRNYSKNIQKITEKYDD